MIGAVGRMGRLIREKFPFRCHRQALQIGTRAQFGGTDPGGGQAGCLKRVARQRRGKSGQALVLKALEGGPG